VILRKNQSGYLAFDPLAELDSGECHLRASPTFSQMSRTHLKPGLRPGFGWCWYTQQLFNAPSGVVHVLKPRSHSENMSSECQKYHIVGNLVAVFKKFTHLGERWIGDDPIYSSIIVKKISSILDLASDDIFDTACFKRPYECTFPSTGLKYQIVLNIDQR